MQLIRGWHLLYRKENTIRVNKNLLWISFSKICHSESTLNWSFHHSRIKLMHATWVVVRTTDWRVVMANNVCMYVILLDVQQQSLLYVAVFRCQPKKLFYFSFPRWRNVSRICLLHDALAIRHCLTILRWLSAKWKN